MYVLLRREHSSDCEYEASLVQAHFATLLLEPVRNGIYKPKQFHGRGVKMVNMGELFANPRLGNVQMRRVELTASEKQRFGVRKGDLLFARRSLVAEGAGKCCVVLDTSEPTAFESSIIRARPDQDKADSLFLYYYFNSPLGLHGLDSIRRQVAVAGITGSDLANLELQLPTVCYQRAIAHILGTLDDKIELNRRMNETYEAMTRAIFKDWFVDFGPTRAKAEGRDPYLAPELWNLFPNALDNEEKPVAWQTYTLSELAHHHRATLSPSAQPELIYEHYSIPAYDAGSEPAIDLGASIKSNKTKVPEGAVLLSKLNPEIERVWLPSPNGEAPQVASTEFLALTPLAPATRNVLYCLFRCPDFRAKMVARVTGTSKSHQRVLPKSILACEVLTANPGLLALFDGTVSAMMNQLLSNRRESRELAQIRDLILPKLMSGEIRLLDAEKAMEAVT